MSLDSCRRCLQLVRQHVSSVKSDDPRNIAARTYGLSLSLSLGPSLFSLIVRGPFSKEKYARLLELLKKELSPSGFAFAMTVAIGGGAALEALWLRLLDAENSGNSSTAQADDGEPISSRLFASRLSSKVSAYRRTLACNALTALLAITLMQRGRRSAPIPTPNIPFTAPIPSFSDRKASRTLDLTLLLLVRALDSMFQGFFQRRAHSPSESMSSPDDELKHTADIRKSVAAMTDKLDAVLFWIASARIMWCFIYKPETLPRSYVKWIGTLANVDPRLLGALRDRRHGTWTYGQRSSQPWLESMAYDLGYPRSWGDTTQLPEKGGKLADDAWKKLGVRGRADIGGVPCEIVHGGVGGSIIPGGAGGSCAANTAIRGSMGFFEALAIYAPVHFLPILLRQPSKLLSFPVLMRTVLAMMRSSLFLSTFISAMWAAVCLTRTVAIARLLPSVSHNFYDGPYGCILAGCLACGGSIWIEQGRRRGEMALYVFPRALRTVMNNAWVKGGSRGFRLIERLVFACSLAALLAAGRHHPSRLRGLSRWVVLFVQKGIKTGAQK